MGVQISQVMRHLRSSEDDDFTELVLSSSLLVPGYIVVVHAND